MKHQASSSLLRQRPLKANHQDNYALLPVATRRPEGSERDYESTSSSHGNDEEGNWGSDSEDNEQDIDGPRIVQWEGEGAESDFESDANVEGSSKITKENPKAEMSTVSFGSLLKARRMLDQARVESDSDNSEKGEDEERADGLDSRVRIDTNQDGAQAKPEAKKPKARAHKHAPIERSSKRPVTRRRQVVEVTKINARDPRFTPLDGDAPPGLFEKNYSFLSDMHKEELQSLKDNLRRARNMLRSSPRDQREEREREVERLERALKRTESLVNQDRREAAERKALERASQEEKERRKAGKGSWYMKNSAKKELLLKARHDALAETGGRFAVRKAIEKRQKKVSQKEKRQRPSFLGRADRNSAEDGSSRRSDKRQKLGMQ